MPVNSIMPLMLVLLAAFVATAGQQKQSTELQYTIVNTYPHRASAFTQGLTFSNGFLWEGTGQYGRSAIAKIRLEDGAVLASKSLPKGYFGEGITLLKGRLLQLTWKAQTVFVYDAADLKLLTTLRYRGEGWGLTHNDEHFIVSDGSNRLQFRSTDDFSLQQTLEVHENEQAVMNLNELEWIEGFILANIWQSDRIVVIDPCSGAIVASLNLQALRNNQHRQADVLNGIAWRQDSQTLFVTGKYWRTLYELRLSPALPRARHKTASACNRVANAP